MVSAESHGQAQGIQDEENKSLTPGMLKAAVRSRDTLDKNVRN